METETLLPIIIRTYLVLNTFWGIYLFINYYKMNEPEKYTLVKGVIKLICSIVLFVLSFTFNYPLYIAVLFITQSIVGIALLIYSYKIDYESRFVPSLLVGLLSCIIGVIVSFVLYGVLI